MEVNVKNIKYKSKSDEFYIVPIGDTHIGNCGFERDRFKELIQWIKQKENCYWIGMGDYLDCITYADKRFDPETLEKKYRDVLSNSVPKQIEDFCLLVRPIMNKCLGLHRGNHEEKIRLCFQYDVMYELWKEFDVPILEDSCLTKLLFTRVPGKSVSETNRIDVFSMHGCCGGRKGGNKINWLEDLIGYIDADVYLIAHSHIKESEVKTQLYVDNAGNIKQRKKVLGVTGSFLRGYSQGCSSYIEKMMLPPTDLGVIRLAIKPYVRDVHVSI